MNTDDKRFDPITQVIIRCAYNVGNGLGAGFLERVYENALVHELKKAGLRVAQQVPIDIHYDGILVGQYIADLIVEDVILVELKAVESLHPVHTAICINYLAATKLPVCLLINFNKRVEIKRLAGPSLAS